MLDGASEAQRAVLEPPYHPRMNRTSVYRRGEAMGEILRTVAGAEDIASIDAHLALLRMVLGNLERYPPLDADSD